MIELLLAAERMLAAGDLDHAERLFTQVAEADPRNAIAVVGLAEVAAARGDDTETATLARRALGIDPENAAARRMLEQLAPTPEPVVDTESAPESESAPKSESAAESEAAAEPESAAEPAKAPTPDGGRRSWLGRLIDFLRRR